MNCTVKNMLGFSLVGATFFLGGCASITQGVHQKIALSTTPPVHARCVLKNDKGTWTVPETPAIVKVHKSIKNLNIVCRHRGYYKAVKSVKSSTAGMAFGNVVFGGLIGGGVDVADGAAFKYPDSITVILQKRGSKRLDPGTVVVTRVKKANHKRTQKKATKSKQPPK